jgi:hypothetical protein
MRTEMVVGFAVAASVGLGIGVMLVHNESAELRGDVASLRQRIVVLEASALPAGAPSHEERNAEEKNQDHAPTSSPTQPSVVRMESSTSPSEVSGWWCYKERCNKGSATECEGRRRSDVSILRSDAESGTLFFDFKKSAHVFIKWDDIRDALAKGDVHIYEGTRGVELDSNNPPCERATAVACMEYTRILDGTNHTSCYSSIAACQRERDRLTADPDWRVMVDCKARRD